MELMYAIFFNNFCAHLDATVCVRLRVSGLCVYMVPICDACSHANNLNPCVQTNKIVSRFLLIISFALLPFLWRALVAGAVAAHPWQERFSQRPKALAVILVEALARMLNGP